MKNLNQVIREGNSTVNQNIKSKFVGQHVYCNVGTLVEPFISQDIDGAPFSFEDIENYFEYPEFRGKHVFFEGGSEEDKDNLIEEIETALFTLDDLIANRTHDKDFLSESERVEAVELIQNFLNDKFNDFDNIEANETNFSEISDDLEDLKNLETEPQEIFEWWAVSDFLYERLKALNHPVLDAGSCLIWGRCTTGQAILLDYAITQICAEMGVLEGQENSWANSQGV